MVVGEMREVCDRRQIEVDKHRKSIREKCKRMLNLSVVPSHSLLTKLAVPPF